METREDGGQGDKYDRLIDRSHEHADGRVDQHDPFVCELHASVSTRSDSSSTCLTAALNSSIAAAMRSRSATVMRSTAERIAVPSKSGVALRSRRPSLVPA